MRQLIPAAFRRLCVETARRNYISERFVPAAFRRLCVETIAVRVALMGWVPAAFRRLCVETRAFDRLPFDTITSRLQAAVC